MRYLSLICALLAVCDAACAATFVLSNSSSDPVECQVSLAEAVPFAVQLVVGESKAIPCGRQIEVSYTSTDGPKRLRLDPYMAYLFVTKKKTGLELMTIDLLGKSPGDKDVPLQPPVAKRIVVPVKLLVDDGERRTKAVWAASLRKRLDEANTVLKAQANVVFDAVDTDEWTVDANVTDFRGAMTDFEKQVKPEPASLAIGFLTRGFAPAKGVVDIPYSISRGLNAPYILIRETEPRTEPERVEVLVQQLGRYLGAVASPDPMSAMRAKLGDGKAVHVKFRISYDPLNLLAINIVAEQLRKGPLPKLVDWPPEMQVRLARIYATLAAAVPEEPLGDDALALLDRAGLRAVAAPPPDVKPMIPPNGVEPPKATGGRILTAEQEAIRKVVRAIVLKAEENAKKPVTTRIKGDELTEMYVRTAADLAFTLEPDLRKKAFLVALGIALDDSDLIRTKPVFGDLWKAVESDDERKSRIVVLGNPTVRYRRDLCQHFAISASLTAIAGPAIAEQIGLAKEMLDMSKPAGSGFSFSDLAADFAGVALANKVLANGETLGTLRQQFSINATVPKIDDLADGLSAAKFKTRYGDTADDRFKKAIEDVRRRVQDLK